MLTMKNKLGPSGCSFVEGIIDGMQDWVRVINKDGVIIFANKAMSEALKIDTVGQKCYSVLGRSMPCPNCITKKALVDRPTTKEEIIQGKTFSISSSPLRNDDGEVVAVVEVMHDITQIKQISEQLQTQNEQLNEELSLAKKFQSSLLPTKQPISDILDFSYIYQPCRALGGDFLDIFKIDKTHVGFYIADASGHGVTASMLTMFLRAALDKTIYSPSKLLTKLFTDFNNSGFEDEQYIAVFYGIIDLESNSMSYSNAGLNISPVLFSKNYTKILRAPGIPICSWLDRPEYTEYTQQLNSGDRLFICTDGIIEIKNASNQQFGEERVIESLTGSKLPPAETLSALLRSALDFSGIQAQQDLMDDITMFLIEINERND